MPIHVSHTTHYEFEKPPMYGLQQLRLTPKSRAGHRVIDWKISVEGGVVEAEFVDFNNNYTHLVRLDDQTDRLSLICEGTVDISVDDGILGPHEGFAPLWYYRRQTELTFPGKHVQKLLIDFNYDSDNSLKSLHDLSAHILGRISYAIGHTGAQTTADLAAAEGKGVCQDHAHVFISCARELGLPARYVSGYLMMDDRTDQDATHAWAEAWIENLGWVGFDVSNQLSPNKKYVRVASGLDYGEAAPISGVTFGTGGETIRVELRVQQQ